MCSDTGRMGLQKGQCSDPIDPGLGVCLPVCTVLSVPGTVPMTW